MKTVLAIFIFIFGVATQADAQWNIHGYPYADGLNKYWMSRSDVAFSARWAQRDNPALSSQGYIAAMQPYDPDALVWHYTFEQFSRDPSNAITSYALQNGINKRNCAFPVNTRIAANAVKDENNQPVGVNGSSITFRADIRTQGFRNEISAYVDQAHQFGCNSFQQDNPYSILTCRTNEFCLTRDAGYPEDTAKQDVRDYYLWLKQILFNEFGSDMPISFNKQWATEFPNSLTSTELVPYFDTAMSEVFEDDNYPEALYKGIYVINNLTHNIPTVTPLRSTSPRRNRRHIATVYALAAHPIAPFDVFVGDGQRFDGNPSLFAPYFQFVKANKPLFDGHGVQDVFVRHYQNSAGDIKHFNTLYAADSQHNQIAVLRGSSSVASRVITVVNWQVAESPRTFSYYVDKSRIPYTPTGVLVHRPGLATISGTIIDGGGNRWKVTIPDVDIWGVAELTGY